MICGNVEKGLAHMKAWWSPTRQDGRMSGDE